MAKPIKATPVVKGEAAAKILREIRSGTANTPKRIETIRRADNVYQAAVKARMPNQ